MAKVLIATAACAASTAAACATQRKQQGRSGLKLVAAIQLIWGALLTGGGIGFAIICMYP
jgi:hypothetical protein